MIIGIDIGGSTTKIVGLQGGKVFAALMVKAGDAQTSAYGAFGRFLSENGLQLSDIDKIYVTGVGSTFLKGPIYGLKTEKVDEISAIGLGGKYLTGLKRAIVVSMGTGTAVIGVDGDRIEHLGGTGIGGGTIIGLSGKLLGIRSIDNIIALAGEGDISKIDLTIGDISAKSISNMNAGITASNFGKVSDIASQADLALGVLNMVFQTIGIVAALAGKTWGIDHIVLTGKLSRLPQVEKMFEIIGQLYQAQFVIPDHSDFATAIGAAIYGEK